MIVKKTAALVLVVTMLWGNAVMPYILSEVHAAEEVTDETSILNAMGISAVDSEDYITRGDFTVLIAQAAGLEHEGMSTSSFTDVSGEQSEYIAAAAMLGFVNGAEKGKFYPDNIISVSDAFTIALRVLGFGSITESDMRKSLIKILKLDNSVPIYGNLKCTDASMLIMNMLEAGYAVYDGMNFTVSDETFMYKTHGIYRTQGIVNGTKGISLSGYPEIENYRICIDETVYENESDVGYEYLGSSGTAYIKEYDDYSAVIWFKGAKSGVITLKSGDIESVSGFDINDSGTPYISYTSNGNRIKTKGVERDALVYLNNVDTVGISNSDLMPESGIVTVIDTDGNNEGDIVIIERYDYYIVDAIDYASKTIYSEDERPDINVSSFSENDISIVYDGEAAELGEIESGTVLSVMCTYDSDGRIDSGKPIVVEILNSSISGTVDSISENESVTISGIKYQYIKSISTKPELGKSGKFHLGKLGEIVCWETDKASDGLAYGYLMKLASDDVKEITYVKIFDIRGNKHQFIVDDINKVKYSGNLSGSYVSERKISRNEFHAQFASKQLVRYSADGERLTRIHKAVDGTSIDGYVGYDEDKFSMDYKGSNERLYAQFLSENYKISTQTMMVGVSKNGDSDEDIAFGGYDFFGTDLSGLSIQIYDSSKTFIPSVVVLTYDNLDAAAKKPNNNFVNTKFAALITDKYDKLNSDNEIVTAYEVYCGGVLTEIEAEDDGLYDVKETNWSGEDKKYFNELQVGDVIQYGTNSKGKVNIIHVIHDHSDLTSRYTMFNSNNHLSEMNTAFGKVTEFESGSYFKLDSSDTRKYPFGRYTPNIYLYDVYTGNIERLLSLTNLSNNDYVFVRCARADIKDIIIYKNE